jgi:glycosyltransferase involved in cell wall biosynthesis
MTKEEKPFVSICTPTFNRRPFIPYIIKCIERQDYPKDKFEWIIIDDGTDKIKDLVTHLSYVKYFEFSTKMSLGEKRNLMHKKSKGEILVYMDDDDYYPTERVSHAVETLLAHPEALCSGSSEIFIYFKHNTSVYKFGPYGPNHATAGTFAFKRKLLETSCYDNKAAIAEERQFLKNYTVPFVQLDPHKTILVFSHDHNTFDKRKLLENPHPDLVKLTDKSVNEFIKDDDMLNFYINDIDKLLKDYEPGRPTMKPDVLTQIIEIEERRRKDAENRFQELAKKMGGKIVIKNNDGTSKELSNDDIIKLLREQTENINTLVINIKQRDEIITNLKEQLLQQNNTQDNINLNIIEHDVIKLMSQINHIN